MPVTHQLLDGDECIHAGTLSVHLAGLVWDSWYCSLQWWDFAALSLSSLQHVLGHT